MRFAPRLDYWPGVCMPFLRPAMTHIWFPCRTRSRFLFRLKSHSGFLAERTSLWQEEALWMVQDRWFLPVKCGVALFAHLSQAWYDALYVSGVIMVSWKLILPMIISASNSSLLRPIILTIFQAQDVLVKNINMINSPEWFNLVSPSTLKHRSIWGYICL